MSKEKQIEEMWNIIITDCDNECVGCEFENDNWCFTHRVINDLYNAGYRKQSEGEWVVEGLYLKTMHCSVCDHTANTIYEKTPYCPNCGAKMKGGGE